MSVTPQTHSRLFVIAPLLAVLAIGLAGCGRRGPLEIPDGSGGSRPAQSSSSSTVYSPAPQNDKPKVIVPSKEPFILDPLL